MAVTDVEAVPVVATDVPGAHADIVVMKFGGTSVATPERIVAVARRLVDAQREGRRVVAVLSAMGGSTDDLVRLAHEVSPRPHPRELDMLVSTGERISCALCAMAVIDLGSRAVSLTGSQAGIVTDTFHGKAKIVEVRARRIHEALEEGRIVLVAGFQGVSTAQEVTTLGRGASDTTAVALAAALGADSCEIYTDVEGVYTADPRMAPAARKLDAVTYDEMLELAASGARVLALRSVELARKEAVRLHVRSAFDDAEGTWVTEEGVPVPDRVVDGVLDSIAERAMIAGVAHTLEETVYRVNDVPAARLFSALATEQVNVDTIVQTGPEIVFSAPSADRIQAAHALDALGATWRAEDDLGKVSVVGAGMKSHPGVAATALSALETAGIEPRVVSTSPIKISVHVGQDEVERAVAALHDAFGLGAEDTA